MPLLVNAKLCKPLNPDPPNVHRELVAALRERLAVIGDRESYTRDADAHLERLKHVSGRIVALQYQLPNPVDPQLQHYLDRSSFDKALAHLEQLTDDAS